MAHTTDPIEVTYGEILPLAINITKALDEGDTVQGTTVVLYEEMTGAEVLGAITGSPGVTGNTLSFVLDTTVMVTRNRYIAKALLTIQPGLKVIAVRVPVLCDL